MPVEKVHAVYAYEYVQFTGDNLDDIIEYLSDGNFVVNILSNVDGKVSAKRSFWSGGEVGLGESDDYYFTMNAGDWIRLIDPYLTVVPEQDFQTCYLVKNI